MKTKTVHYIDDEVTEEEDLDHYKCAHCGTCIKDYEWGFREDAYGYYYCDSEEDCRNALIDNCNHIEYRSEEEEVAEKEE
jgi:hypothetical protein